MHYRTAAQLSRDMNALANKLAVELKGDIARVVGIPRSGTLAAASLGAALRVPTMELPEYLRGEGGYHGFRQLRGHENGVTLVIDDSCSSGREIGQVKEAIRDAGIPGRVLYGAAYVTPESREMVDFHALVVPTPRAFEWNILHHYGALSVACVDMDGFLCEDPTRAVNDDGPLYRNFLRTAQPLHVPDDPVFKIVTARLAKYREETAKWLERHGVKYGELVMLENVTAEERRDRDLHAPFKADVYARSGASIFMESDRHQAAQIHRLSGLPVFATDTMEFMQGTSLYFRDSGFQAAAESSPHFERATLLD